jgi:aspartyl-tRNA(Asn)/glutamyl-tRNA(Gln) amidotransferase subunit A
VTPEAILELSATELARAIREKRVSCVAAMEAAIARMKAVHSRLNCLVRSDDETALAAAHLADKELARGALRGPLHGVPMAHKDMYYRRGVASSCGSKIVRERPASSTATALERLDSAGSIQFGVLNMAEFAFGPTGHNWHFGHCRNAWDPSRVTGGSSSGSATAVAARATFAALGSDTGGSIRLPAHFCGVSGSQPTYGRVSRAGAMPLSFSLDTVGPLARTVEDCALVLQVIAGADPRDPTCETRAVPDYIGALERPIAGLRIGRPRQFFYDDSDPEIAAALQASLETFERLGATVIDVDIPDIAPWNFAGTLIISAEAAAYHGNWLRTRPQDYSDQVRGRLEQGLAVPAASYLDALRLRPVALREFCAQVFSQVDVLHAPVVSFQTPTIAETDLGAGPQAVTMLGRTTRLTRPGNFLGLPAVSLNAGFTKAGMPIGMQLLARPHEDATALGAGHAFQKATDWHKRAPAR